MKLEVQRKDLCDSLARFQSVVDKRHFCEQLRNVLVSAAGDVLTIGGTNLTQSLASNLTAKVEETGALCVNAKDLLARAKALPGDVLALSSDGGSLTVASTSGSPSFRLPIESDADFPRMPMPSSGADWTPFVSSIVKRVVSSTEFAVSDDDTRLHLSSALFEWSEVGIRVVATDGHQLVKYETAAVADASPVLVPREALVTIRKLCGAGETVRFSRSEGLMFVESGANCLAVKLTDATFPPYEKVIPSKAGRSVRVARKPLIEVLKRIRLSASKYTKGVKLVVGKNLLTTSASCAHSGESSDSLPAKCKALKETFGFNSEYLLNHLNAISDEFVTLGLSGELDPATIKPASDSCYLGVLMPMRI